MAFVVNEAEEGLNEDVGQKNSRRPSEKLERDDNRLKIVSSATTQANASQHRGIIPWMLTINTLGEERRQGPQSQTSTNCRGTKPRQIGR